MNYVYGWKNNEKRAGMFGRLCRVVARGALGSVLIEFEDGQREVVSRRSIRRTRAAGGGPAGGEGEG